MKKKQNFGVTLLKVFVIALVFGIVAASAFEGFAYFLGDRFNLAPITIGNPVASAEQEPIGEERSFDTEPEEETEEPVEKEAEATPAVVDEGSVRETIADTRSDADIVESVMPSIVAITNISIVEYNTFWGQRGSYQAESAGSGIIIQQDEDSLYVVTNEHVIANAESLTVQFVDEESVPGTVKGEDSSRDLAVVEVSLKDIPEETRAAIRVATIGDSTVLRVGEPAIAIGNALGYGQSITKGVISALNREVTVTDESTGSSIMNLCIQTDAAINPGNSGGALLNSDGEVIGINEVKYASTDVEGIGYAIPMATAQPIIEQIITHGEIDGSRAAFLGIQGVEIGSDDAEKFGMPEGIYLAQVVPGSAADEAGLQIGDIITAFDGREIKTQDELTNLMSLYAAGDRMEITFMRTSQGEYAEYTTIATLGSRND